MSGWILKGSKVSNLLSARAGAYIPLQVCRRGLYSPVKELVSNLIQLRNVQSSGFLFGRGKGTRSNFGRGSVSAGDRVACRAWSFWSGLLP